jgi:phosphoribosyl 1,2-cyclic phosphate phosphodiesterase
MVPADASAPPRTLRFTVLGSGTSMGVPTVGCECAVCRSTHPRDKRTRASVLLTYGGRNVVIDTTPDFRYQALRAGLKRLDAVVFTHAHADHILGLDDIRPFNLKQQAPLPVYAAEDTLDTLRRTFSYIFDPRPTLSTIPSIVLNRIDGPLHLFGLELTPVRAAHGDMTVLGFRFGRAAYLTDFSSVPDASKELLRDLDDLVLDALRYTPHPMHSTIAQSLRLVDELRPRRAWFTHMSHDVAHETSNAELAAHPGPTQVRLAWDGLSFDVRLGPRLRVFRAAHEWAVGTRPDSRPLASFLSIGNFDGLHLGHQKILRTVVEQRDADARTSSRPCLAGVVTFDPHPLKLLRPAEAPAMLATLHQRLDSFELAGLDAALVLNFDEPLSRLSAKEFVLEVLVNQLSVKHVLVGANFRFGHRQAGDVEMLRGLGRQFGFSVEVVPPVDIAGETVSSTGIRRALGEGNVAHAARLLGQPFVLSGAIVPGTGTGRAQLVPTLNLRPEQECLPAQGVYVTEAVLEEETVRAVTNIGVRPTVDTAARGLTVESHLLDFDRSVTRGTLALRFLGRLRDEQKFPSLDALREQIHADIARARSYTV